MEMHRFLIKSQVDRPTFPSPSNRSAQGAMTGNSTATKHVNARELEIM